MAVYHDGVGGQLSVSTLLVYNHSIDSSFSKDKLITQLPRVSPCILGSVGPQVNIGISDQVCVQPQR